MSIKIPVNGSIAGFTKQSERVPMGAVAKKIINKMGKTGGQVLQVYTSWYAFVSNIERTLHQKGV